MSFDKLFTWIVGAVVAVVVVGKLPQLQLWIWRSQLQLIRESRTETWGSPRFFQPVIP